MARTMGSIIAVEAMLEIPMERMAVVLMNPNINLRDREKKKTVRKISYLTKKGGHAKKALTMLASPPPPEPWPRLGVCGDSTVLQLWPLSTHQLPAW